MWAALVAAATAGTARVVVVDGHGEPYADVVVEVRCSDRAYLHLTDPAGSFTTDLGAGPCVATVILRALPGGVKRVIGVGDEVRFAVPRDLTRPPPPTVVDTVGDYPFIQMRSDIPGRDRAFLQRVSDGTWEPRAFGRPAVPTGELSLSPPRCWVRAATGPPAPPG